MKVVKTFFCIQTKKKYFPGDEYKGKRKDLGHLLESVKPPKKEKK